jgi:hypothetical protein
MLYLKSFISYAYGIRFTAIFYLHILVCIYMVLGKDEAEMKLRLLINVPYYANADINKLMLSGYALVQTVYANIVSCNCL